MVMLVMGAQDGVNRIKKPQTGWPSIHSSRSLLATLWPMSVRACYLVI